MEDGAHHIRMQSQLQVDNLYKYKEDQMLGFNLDMLNDIKTRKEEDKTERGKDLA